MIRRENQTYILTTDHTAYLFSVTESGHLEHLYYGRKITVKNPDALLEKHAAAPGNACIYDRKYPDFSLEDAALEMSSCGKGDIFEPFVEIVHADGARTCDFLFEKDEIRKGKKAYQTLPGSYGMDEEVEHLCVTLLDRQYDLRLELHYYVYENCDVICRSARLLNDSRETVQIRRLMSTQLDFHDADLVFTIFQGAWAREMQRFDMKIHAGKHVNASCAGTSSSRANPFVMISRDSTSEDFGDCYGLNLIYSGNHYEAAEVTPYGKTRLVAGIHPQSFSWMLQPGERFEAPEAVMAYSCEGFNGMSQCMHQFVRRHIVRGEWQFRERPVLLNSWEAAYFDIDEQKLLSMAKAGKDAGVELFVLDDGWFGERNDEQSSLGDWTCNLQKLPDGIDGLARKIKAMGLKFGIWVEPEMVNVKSRLYRTHPDWTMEIPGKPHSEGRNQRILDLTRTEVQDFIIESMSSLFSSAEIHYVKWDMNRIFSDCYSAALPAERQGETAHRYVLGLYRTMRVLSERFPHILFEGCSSGGNRFDLGILCHFPQIWASDNTDAFCRAQIQTGLSYGYPPSVIGAHVSACPNHQTHRTTPAETRFHVAAFGVFGYECNFCDMNAAELAAVRAQIELYKNWRKVLQFGSFYRGRTFCSADHGNRMNGTAGNAVEWICVSPDQRKAAGMLLQRLVQPNTTFERYRARGLSPDMCYHFYSYVLQYKEESVKEQPHTAEPSLRDGQNSLPCGITAEYAHMAGETEDLEVYGDTLMYHGVKLKQPFAADGYQENAPYYTDFGSRMFFMEALQKHFPAFS